MNRITPSIIRGILFTFFFIGTWISINNHSYTINPNQKYKMEKGMPYAALLKTLNKKGSNRNIYLVGQKKMPWRETFMILGLINKVPELSQFNPLMKNVDYLALSVNFMKRVEDIILFQSSKGSKKKVDISAVKNCEFFQHNMFGDYSMKFISNLPFICFVTCNESEVHQGQWINQYCFANAYDDNKSTNRKILLLEVADDNIERIRIFDSLFAENKIEFLSDLKNSSLGYLTTVNVGRFLKILGSPLHYEVFADGRTRFLYGDEKSCVHMSQRISLIIDFDKELIMSSINLFLFEVCSICETTGVLNPLPYYDSQLTTEMIETLDDMNPQFNLDSFYYITSYRHWETSLYNQSYLFFQPITLPISIAKSLAEHLYDYGIALEEPIFDSKDPDDTINFYLDAIEELGDDEDNVTLYDLWNVMCANHLIARNIIALRGQQIESEGKELREKLNKKS